MMRAIIENACTLVPVVLGGVVANKDRGIIDAELDGRTAACARPKIVEFGQIEEIE